MSTIVLASGQESIVRTVVLQVLKGRRPACNAPAQGCSQARLRVARPCIAQRDPCQVWLTIVEERCSELLVMPLVLRDSAV